jgi:hypothetical protein
MGGGDGVNSFLDIIDPEKGISSILFGTGFAPWFCLPYFEKLPKLDLRHR